MRKSEMKGYVGNHYDKLGLKRISCASQLTSPDTEGTAPDLAGKISERRSSNLNQASRTPNFSYPLVFSIMFPPSSSFSVSCPQLYHHYRTQS